MSQNRSQNMHRHIVVLAAGRGTRMKSAIPKVLHKLAHRPLIGHVLASTDSVKPDSCHLVIPPHADLLTAYCSEEFPDVQLIEQRHPNGTGGAVACALTSLPAHGDVVIVYGDTPLIQNCTIQKIFDELAVGCDAVVMGMELNDPQNYGRLILNDQGNLLAIVEYNNATPAQRAIKFCNAGIIGFKLEHLHKYLGQIAPGALNQEIYLTDMIAVLNQHNHVCKVIFGDSEQALGINTCHDLSQIEALYQNNKRQQMMTNGVTLQNPNSVYFAFDTIIEPDVTIEPHVYFGPGVLIKSGSRIRAFSAIEGATINNNVSVGPFAHIRPGTVIDDHAKVGNFVELKKTHLGPGSKVSHLSYLGDTTVGEKTNIGAGTITCNYDGYNKFSTIIGNNVFVGSNTALIAPLTIDDNTMIGAGSVITQDTAPNDLAIARAPQKNIRNGAVRLKARLTNQKDLK